MKPVITIFLIFTLIIGLYAGIPFYMAQNVKDQIHHDLDDLPKQSVALIPGAQVYLDAELSDIYQDRVDRALELYQNNKVDKILISGSTEGDYYDEVSPVQEFLLINGVRERDLILDYAGFDTYDSIYRAAFVYKVQSITIVTQSYHLPRALYIANQLKLPAEGMSSDLHEYFNILSFKTRENLATFKALFDTAFLVESAVTEKRTANPAFAQ